MASHFQPSATASIVGVHYRVGQKIGEGSFGVIYEGLFTIVHLSDPKTALSWSWLFLNLKGTNLLNSQTVAIKFVCIARKAFISVVHSIFPLRNLGRLKHLNFVMNVAHIVYWPDVVSFLSIFFAPLWRSSLPSLRAAGIPRIYHFGQEGLYNVLVIDLLGPSLEDLFDMCGRKFTLKTVCMAAKQMVRIGRRPYHTRTILIVISQQPRSLGCKRFMKRTSFTET